MCIGVLNNTFSAAVSNSTVKLYQLPHILNKETSLQLHQHWLFLSWKNHSELGLSVKTEEMFAAAANDFE